MALAAEAGTRALGADFVEAAERALASGFQSRWESGKAAITFCVVRTSRSKRVTVRSLVAMAKSSL